MGQAQSDVPVGILVNAMELRTRGGPDGVDMVCLIASDHVVVDHQDRFRHRDAGLRHVVPRASSADLLGIEGDEDERAPGRLGHGGERAGDSDQRPDSRCVVVGSKVDGLSALTQVVVVGSDDDRLPLQGLVAPGEYPNDVAADPRAPGYRRSEADMTTAQRHRLRRALARDVGGQQPEFARRQRRELRDELARHVHNRDRAVERVGKVGDPQPFPGPDLFSPASGVIHEQHARRTVGRGVSRLVRYRAERCGIDATANPARRLATPGDARKHDDDLALCVDAAVLVEVEGRRSDAVARQHAVRGYVCPPTGKVDGHVILAALEFAQRVRSDPRLQLAAHLIADADLEGLEVAARAPAGEQPDPAKFTGDVAGRLSNTRCCGFTAVVRRVTQDAGVPDDIVASDRLNGARHLHGQPSFRHHAQARGSLWREQDRANDYHKTHQAPHKADPIC